MGPFISYFLVFLVSTGYTSPFFSSFGLFLLLFLFTETYTKACVCAQSLSHVWLFATPWIRANQAPLSVGFSRVRILERAAMPSFKGSFLPRDWTSISCIAHRVFTTESHGRPEFSKQNSNIKNIDQFFWKTTRVRISFCHTHLFSYWGNFKKHPKVYQFRNCLLLMVKNIFLNLTDY